MYAKTLSDYVRAYLDQQAFLDECRADGRPTDAAAEAVARASRAIVDMLERSRPSAPPDASAVASAVADATRRYLDAEHAFDEACAGGGTLDVPARRMERARRDLERRLESPAEDRVLAVKVRRVPQDTTRPPRRRRILVPYDESAPARHALAVAVQSARESGGRLTLLNVVRPATGDGGAYVCSLDGLDTLHHAEADEMLARVRRGLPPSVEADVMVREGLAADEILAAAAACEADLIVMGTRGRGRLAQFLLGGTAEAVIRRAACPVTVVGRRAAWAEGADGDDDNAAELGRKRPVELAAATA